jgi:hypothetical protein
MFGAEKSFFSALSFMIHRRAPLVNTFLLLCSAVSALAESGTI